MADLRLVYVSDTYCPWCWGFYPALAAVRAQFTDLDIEVVMGGLLLGERAVPVGEKPGVRRTVERVHEVTGVAFGEGFYEALADGRAVQDSLWSARLFTGLSRQLGRAKDLSTAHALQSAWYADGHDLQDRDVVGRLAADLGADPAGLEAWLRSEESTVAARQQFARRQELGIASYPSLHLAGPEGVHQVGWPTSSPLRMAAAIRDHL